MKVMFVTGPPLSGKTTAAVQLVRQQDVQYVISPGQWLRRLQDTDLAAYVRNNGSNEDLDPLVIEHVHTQLERCARQPSIARVIVEGFPRTVAQAEYARTCQNALTMFLCMSETLAHERAQKRQRTGDDHESAVHQRSTYWATLEPLIQAQLGNDAPTAVTDVDATHGDLAGALMDVFRAAIQRDVVLPTTATGHHGPLELAPATESAQTVQMHQRLLGRHQSKRQFCGPHPVSLDRANMSRLLRYPYLCAIKLDGERMMVCIHSQRLYLFNRKLVVYRTRVPDPRLLPYHETLFDAEMCAGMRVVVIDCVCVAGRDVTMRPIIERLSYIHGLVQLFRSGPLTIHVQEYVDRTQLRALVDRHRQTPSDGCILQPAKLPLRVGIDYNLFKWKPAEHNAVDLLYADDGRLYCRKTSSGEETAAATTGVMLRSVGTLAADAPWLHPGSVVECRYLGDDQWMPLKVRTDKAFPNIDWVVTNILVSARDDITLNELIDYCQHPPLPATTVAAPPRVSSSFTE